MAYALETFVQILEQDQHHANLACNPQINSLLEKARHLRDICVKLSFPKLGDLESRIRDVVYKAEDLIESHIRDQVLSVLQDGSSELDLKNFLVELDSIREEILNIQADKEPVDSAGSGSVSDDPGPKSSMVGLTEDFRQLLDELVGQEPDLQIMPIVGMGGIGKTTLTRQLFYHQSAVKHFAKRVWITIPQESSVRATLLAILGSLTNLTKEMRQLDDDQLGGIICSLLRYHRYLIVVDGIWDVDTWEEIRRVCPDYKSGSRIMLTTRVSSCCATDPSHHYQMRFMNASESWELLCAKVFGEESFPLELENVGKMIAERCQGLPLAIIWMANLLSKIEKKVEHWERFAMVANSMEVHLDSEVDILSKSYNHLPCNLKPCFLYVGAFIGDHEIRVSRIVNLWVAEGFVRGQNLEDTAEEYLKALSDENLLLACQKEPNGRIRTFKIHFLLRKLCETKAFEEKFLWFKHLEYDGVPEQKDQLRRVSMDPLVQPTSTMKLASFVRSFLCVGPYLQRLAPFFLGLTLLRVLDVFHVEFFQFPKELLELVLLRYLSFSCHANLPSSISRLRNLQTIVVRRLPSFREFSLPQEFWELTQLRHIKCKETCIWYFPDDGAPQENLQTLSNIHVFVVTDSLLDNIPNLRKLGLYCNKLVQSAIHLDRLSKLEKLKCSSNLSQTTHNFLSYLTFPPSLRKLTLMRCKIPWGFMEIVGSLPNLEQLKLQKCAFLVIGNKPAEMALDVEDPEEETEPTWEQVEYQFSALIFLQMEDLNLVYWKANETHFPRLEQLIIRGRSSLREIPFGIEESSSIKVIEVDEYCSSSVIASAKDKQKKRIDLEDNILLVDIVRKQDTTAIKLSQVDEEHSSSIIASRKDKEKKQIELTEVLEDDISQVDIGRTAGTREVTIDAGTRVSCISVLQCQGMSESAVSRVIQSLRKLQSSKVRLSQGIQKQIERLSLTLQQLHSISRTADARQHEDDWINRWVLRTRVVTFDVEDLLDVFAIEILSRNKQSPLRRPSQKKSINTLQDIESKITSLVTTWQAHNNQDLSFVSERHHRVRTPLVEDFVGLDEEIDELVTQVLKDDAISSCHVVSIIGKGGIGKTALARRIYHHEDVRGQFDAFAWAIVSQHWQAEDVLQRILFKLVPERREQIASMGNIAVLVKELLDVHKTRKCLVVLDDVCETDVWDSLKPAFPNWKSASRVLLTTRQRRIAFHIDADTTCYLYEQRHLDEKESWDLLLKKALPVINFAVRYEHHGVGSDDLEDEASNAGSFRSCQSVEGEDEFLRNVKTSLSPNAEVDIEDNRINMEEVRKEMAEHCGGLPLAINLLGGILMAIPNEWIALHHSFKSLLRDRSFEETPRVYEVLSLGYHDLPYQIKQCFWHLRNFPKSYNISTRKLYQLWAAEGFTLSVDEEEASGMDIAQRYLRELDKRFMVQVQIDESTDTMKSCQLHDLVREMCILKGNEENFQKVTSTSSGASHLLFTQADIHFETSRTSELEYTDKEDFLRDYPFSPKSDVYTFSSWKSEATSNISGSSHSLLSQADSHFETSRTSELEYTEKEDFLRDYPFSPKSDVYTFSSWKSEATSNISGSSHSLLSQADSHSEMSITSEQEDLLTDYPFSPKSDVYTFSSWASEATSNSSGASHSRLSQADSHLEMSITELEDVEHVRSALFFSKTNERKYLQSTLKSLCDSYKLLRELDLEKFEFGHELCESIGNLVHLRFLSFRGSKFNKLPSSVGSLRFLETLDLRVTYEAALVIPDVLWKLSNLKHLYLPRRQNPSNKLQLSSLTSLEILKNFNPYISDLRDIRKLNKLKKLKVVFCVEMEHLKAINKYLRISSTHLNHSSFRIHYNFKSPKELTLLEQLVSCVHLRKLDLVGRIEKLPEHYHFSQMLNKLILRNSFLKEDPLAVLEKLPNLYSLTLCKNAYTGRRICCSARGFAKLQTIEVQGLSCLEDWIIEEGSMRKLLQLKLDCCTKLVMLPDGFKFLSSVREIVVANMPEAFQQTIQSSQLEGSSNLSKVTFIGSYQSSTEFENQQGPESDKELLLRSFAPGLVPKTWQDR